MQEVAAVRVVFFFGMLSVLSALPILCCSGAAKQPPPMVGGRCEYKHYRGAAEIVSVTRISSAEEGLQGEYEVGFLFHPQQEIEEQFVQATTKVFRLFTDSGANPGRLFIERHDIRVGKRIDCLLNVIIRGTCTPVMFEFPWTGSRED